MKTVDSAMHLGIHPTNTISKNSELNIEENLKKARRVVNSLMSSGMHGHNVWIQNKSTSNENLCTSCVAVRA